MNKKVFAFDLGKTSIGFCVREGFDIKDLGSIILDKDHAEVTSNRERRRIFKTLLAHKAREKFFDDLWESCGLNVLNKNDSKITTEFANKNDDTIYNSILLRIALLQNIRLEEWQIYKALYCGIQRRGYDSKLPWANKKSNDDTKNEEMSSQYTEDDNKNELIIDGQYKYPCYYDAKRLGLWSENEPNKFKRHIPICGIKKVRDVGIVAPREMVENELKQLYINAQKQLPKLQKYSYKYFLYGEYEESYGSYKNPQYRKYRGTENDWQGVLGQKIPRFDNRIIMKCKLLPKRNVCKANTIENVAFVLLMKLKNLRFTDEFNEKCMLDSTAIKLIYENWLRKAQKETELKLDTSITKKEIEQITGIKIKEKIEPLKANITGRSSFCRRSCKIMNKIILEGIENPLDMNISEFVDKKESKNGIFEEEIKIMLSKLGSWDNLYIPDNRYEMAEKSSDEREKTDILIGNITNPIVRNRLQIFRDQLLEMKRKYGEPDEIIFEFIRDGADNSLLGAKKAKDTLKMIKENEEKNKNIIEELKAAGRLNSTNIDKLKLLKMQGGMCVYSATKIGIDELDKCDIDHIYPRSRGGNDAIYNKVLCYAAENRKKGDKTPYEWLHEDEDRWDIFANRVLGLKDKLGKKKFELLTSSPESCKKLIESYNALAETAQIARVAQDIAAFIFGWGLQTAGDKRRIFVNNGSSTAAIRKRYGLNKILGDDVKKNRENDKHHALDAICISFSRDFKYDKKSNKDIIEGFTADIAKTAIDKLIPYPYANKKPFKGNIKPCESIYGKREINNITCLVKKTNLKDISRAEKKVRLIVDESIKNDLLSKLELSDTEWKKMLNNYTHPKKKTSVKKVLLIESEGKIEKDSNGRERIGEYVDFGSKGTKNQFKHSKGHKGQILYYNNKSQIKVMPIYANAKIQDVNNKLETMEYKLYKKGMMFHSGCLIEIPQNFNASVYSKIIIDGKEKIISEKKEVEAGIFKVRTIRNSGAIKLEDASGIEILTSANILAALNFKKIQK